MNYKGCGALKELDSRSGEIKSMRTAKAHRRKGVASKILEHIIKEAEQRAYDCLKKGDRGNSRVRPSTSLIHTLWVL
ncbi:GNAT family N-acetyltransferase [Nostoc sp. CHAB 5784]|uniref:GNAT family N-acetyltransferase n=1 Tax=Nostoc mirabile TaxID=2907820 RepID=UPI0027DEF455|nr:GNAT family N-acetyltransferase [Nostoc mirabile]MCC5670222.1 GNAT family N-acetyltransferase [Nostoc mirabile CHAB5784]